MIVAVSNWPAPNVSGFIAQLVEHRTGKWRYHGFKPRWSPEFFSGFFTQLHKLHSLRRSFLHLHFISAVHIWFISYIINMQKIYHNFGFTKREQTITSWRPGFRAKWSNTGKLNTRKGTTMIVAIALYNLTLFYLNCVSSTKISIILSARKSW